MNSVARRVLLHPQVQQRAIHLNEIVDFTTEDPARVVELRGQAIPDLAHRARVLLKARGVTCPTRRRKTKVDVGREVHPIEAFATMNVSREVRRVPRSSVKMMENVAREARHIEMSLTLMSREVTREARQISVNVTLKRTNVAREARQKKKLT